MFLFINTTDCNSVDSAPETWSQYTDTTFSSNLIPQSQLTPAVQILTVKTHQQSSLLVKYH